MQYALVRKNMMATRTPTRAKSMQPVFPPRSWEKVEMKLALDLTRSALIGRQRRTKDRVKKEQIGTLLKQLETRQTAFGEHRERLDRYIAHQLRLLAA